CGLSNKGRSRRIGFPPARLSRAYARLQVQRAIREDNLRLKNRIAIVVGAGQSPGEGTGNGRATALTFAREGASVLCVDHHLNSAQDTADMIAAAGGTARTFRADVTRAADIAAMVAEAH